MGPQPARVFYRVKKRSRWKRSKTVFDVAVVVAVVALSAFLVYLWIELRYLKRNEEAYWQAKRESDFPPVEDDGEKDGIPKQLRRGDS